MAASDDDRPSSAGDPEDLQREIEASRGHLTDTLTALEQKLSTRRLTHDAVDAVRDAVLGPSDGSKDMFEIIRRNPIPAALIGIGVGWMLFGSPSPRRSPPQPGARRHDQDGPGLAAQARDTVARYGAEAQDTVARYGAQARALAGTAQQRAGALAHDNPVIIGALGLAVGAVLGTMLPMTRRESALLGDIQAQVVSQAEALGREALERARVVAEHAGRAAVDAVEHDLGVDGNTANGHAKH
ncbi:MAG: DUF3618 domain-containing protein [Pseudomonadota bacterium]